ncbi:MAG: asparaginase domain-containing protein [Desulfovibrionales bacterium]
MDTIVFFTVGGTIDKVYFDKLSEYQIGPPKVQTILESLPVSFCYEVESLMRKDSLDMTPEDRRLIFTRVRQTPCPRVIITHGTDTMVETAKTLLPIPDKTIVLTGAMEPASFTSTDAVFNLGTAVGAVSSLPAGVYITMNGRIFDPSRTRKNRREGTFEEI